MITIRASADSGKTWREEYSTFDVEAMLKQLVK